MAVADAVKNIADADPMLMLSLLLWFQWILGLICFFPQQQTSASAGSTATRPLVVNADIQNRFKAVVVVVVIAAAIINR